MTLNESSETPDCTGYTGFLKLLHWPSFYILHINRQNVIHRFSSTSSSTSFTSYFALNRLDAGTGVVSLGTFTQLEEFILLQISEVPLLLRHSLQGLMFRADGSRVFFHLDGKESCWNIWSTGLKLAESAKLKLKLFFFLKDLLVLSALCSSFHPSPSLVSVLLSLLSSVGLSELAASSLSPPINKYVL